MALLGDHGFLHRHGVEKAARDARLTQIYQVTNQINPLAIIEGQPGARVQDRRLLHPIEHPNPLSKANCKFPGTGLICKSFKIH